MSVAGRLAGAPQLTLSLQQPDARHRAVLARHRVARWVRAALARPGEITVRIVDEDEGRALNQSYRGKDYATNVLTFDYAQAPRVAADLVLCAPVVAREATELKISLADHYAHLLVHGTLHAQGWDHETSAADADAMEAEEAAILARLGVGNPYATVREKRDWCQVEIKRVREAAVRVRRAIESIACEDLPITFSHFPSGACGDASLLLGTYLEDQCGFGSFDYISGERGSHDQGTWTSHAWLQRGDLVVDITADQFPDAPAPVIVAAPSLWHRAFEVESTHPANLNRWSGTGAYDVLKLYARVRRLLDRRGA